MYFYLLCTFSFACPKEKDTKKKVHRLRPSGYSEASSG